jgi:hypothetical protein
MKLLINDKEIAHFLLSLIDYDKFIKDIEQKEEYTSETVIWWLHKKTADGNKWNANKHAPKLKQKLRRSVEQDTSEYFKFVNSMIKFQKERHYDFVHSNIEYFIEKIGEEKIFELYRQHQKKNFVKNVGLRIDDQAEFIRRKNFNDYEGDCLIRNTVGNEDLLITKIDKTLPFWFIDSGYTNFLEEYKTWHRLVRNHLHYGKFFDCPVDRLHIFKRFPKPWREEGHSILVVEPGPFAAGIFHVDLKTWKYEVEKTLKNYTDKKIVFREKAPKKQRESLFQHLMEEDYYCLININSNAATEAIWAGVPAITLDLHITNPVTRNKLSDINDLYRPNLAQWLSMLSYSQFTFDELTNGTALEIVSKYHG